MARRLILDTTVLIAAERTGDTLSEYLNDDDDVAIATITAAELLVGVELADDKHRGKRQAFVTAALAGIPAEDYTLSVAAHHARLMAHVRRAGKARGAHDLIIAATALATERTIVTADAAAGFDQLPGVTAAVV